MLHDVVFVVLRMRPRSMLFSSAMKLYNFLRETGQTVSTFTFMTRKRGFYFTAFERNVSCLTYLFLPVLTVFDWKINENSCSRAELQVVVGLALYELSIESSRTN